MKSIFFRTLSSLFKPITMIIYFILTIGVTVFISVINKFSDISKVPIEMQKIQVIETFTLLVFVWVCGITLMLLIMAIGSGLFAAEESEGTMRILLAKPVSRESVVFGKILGLIVGSFLYMISSLIISITLYSLITSIDKDILNSIIRLIPNYILYGLFIILFFSGITSLFSSLFKKRIPAIIILIVIILLTFGILPIGRAITSSMGVYERYKIYLFDINYHLGNIYMNILESNGKLNISPSGEESLGMFSGTYINKIQDPDMQSNNDAFYAFKKRNDSLNSTFITILYSIITIISYILCYTRMKKKDIT